MLMVAESGRGIPTKEGDTMVQAGQDVEIDTTVQAAPTVRWQPPVPVGASPKMAALRPFHFDCAWTGTVAAGGMGPGSPEMAAAGKATYRPIMDGGWLVGDFAQDQFVDGARVLTWKAHFVVGWDRQAGEYRATYVDNNGSAALLRGWIEGPRFIVELMGDAQMRNRMEWALLAGGGVRWRNEGSVAGGPWFLVEEYVCTPLSPAPA
jgi:hypothetical protein